MIEHTQTRTTMLEVEMLKIFSIDLRLKQKTGQRNTRRDKEERVSPSSLNRILSPETSEFVPKSATAKKNESETLASKLNSFASDEDLSEKELNTFASDEDLSEEEEEKEKEEELDICFEKVARDGDISPRQQRSGSRKNKKKTHGRQHS
ncbi:hypothetical protein BC332_34853 [Capsicum chinense]|nr:hypothetical protein BC332_34853 [Capsicum chinense]